MLPSARNEYFAGREEELQSLEQSLLPPTTYQRMTVFGSGGIGKSVLSSKLFGFDPSEYQDRRISSDHIERLDRTVTGANPATKPHLSEYDSGYGSASRPAMSAKISESAIQGNDFELYAMDKHDRTKTEHDIQSLVSENDDIGSQISTGGIKAGLTGQALISIFLAEDNRVRALCEKVLARTDKPRFAENVRRLLRSFHKNLCTEASSEGEKAVARLLQQRLARLRISHRLINSIEDQAKDDDKPGLVIVAEDKLSLEKWLANIANAPTDLPEEEPQVQDSVDKSTEPEAHDDFPFTSELKQFLQDSKSFKSLVRDLMLWLLPVDLREVLLSIPRSCIWVSRDQDRTLTNFAKAWVEDNTKVDWNWWPLEARKRTLKNHESRLYWRCTCGKRQWMEISTAYNELVEGVLELMDDIPLAPRQCRMKRMRVPFLATYQGVFRTVPSILLATLTSAAASRYTPSTITTSPSPSPPPGSQYSAALPIPSLQHTASPTVSQLQTTNQDPLNRVQSYILFGVQGGTRRLVPTQVPIYDQSTDASILKEIRQCYRAQRGRIRFWFSIWRLEYCAVVKFNRLNVKHMVHEYRELPKNQDYSYSPRAGEPDAKNPPLSPHLFEALYYTCPMPCTKWFPHNCSSPPDSTTAVNRFPKRVKCFHTDLTSSIWGLEAVFTVSVVHVVVYHLILMAGPFVFFGLWIDDNPGDLQNAIVPATMAVAGLSLLWMISGILTSEKD